MTNEERLAELKEEQEITLANFHRVSGAIAILEQMIQEKEKKVEKKK